MPRTRSLALVLLPVGCGGNADSDSSPAPSPSPSPTPSFTPEDFNGQWCRVIEPLSRAVEDAPYFPGHREGIRNLREASEETDELVTSLDEANLRNLADDVRVLEGQLDAWIAAIDTNRTDIDAITEAFELQGRHHRGNRLGGAS